MASLGKFHYYSTVIPAIDVAFGYPIMQAPPDKAIKITSLAIYNLTNSANGEIVLSIIPSTTSKLADGTYSIVDTPNFVLGLVSASLTASNSVSPLTYTALATKGPGLNLIIVPPGAILVGYPSPTGNLNGTIQAQSIGYECEAGY